MKKELKMGYIFIVITVIIWGLDNVLFKDILNYISPNISSFMRFATCFIVNSLILILSKKKVDKSLINKEYIKNALYMGLCLIVMYLFVFNGLSITKATLVEFVNSGLGSLVAILVLSLFITKEKNIAKDKYFITALLVALLGTFFTSNINNSILNLKLDLGILYVFIGSIGFAFYTMIISKTNNEISVFRINRDISAVALVIMTVICIFTNEFKQLFQIDMLIVIKVVVISVFVDIIAVVCYYKAVRIISGVKSNVFILLCPIITAVVSYFYLKENINTMQLVGCSLLFLSGVIIVVKDYIDEKTIIKKNI